MDPMFLKFRHAFIVAVIGFADVVASGGTGQASAVERTEGSTDGTAHPLVTLLLKCPGPTAPLDKLLRKAEVEVEQPIPDAPATGLQSDLVLGDDSKDPGSRIYGIEVFPLALAHRALEHSYIAELGSGRQGRSPGVPTYSLVVRKPGVDGVECFLFEYRDASGYDNAVADRGVVAWHVRENRDFFPSAGEGDNVPGHAIYAVGPDSERGAQRAWKPSDGRFRLRWADGSLLPATYWVETPASEEGRVFLKWSAADGNRSPGQSTRRVLPRFLVAFAGGLAVLGISWLARRRRRRHAASVEGDHGGNT